LNSSKRLFKYFLKLEIILWRNPCSFQLLAISSIPGKPIRRINMKSKTSPGIQPIKLPKPVLDKCKPIRTALRKRHTTREISGRKISLQTLSDLLWSASGVNRKSGPFGLPGRTAGSASNSREIDIYVLMKDGTYLYVSENHSLEPVTAADLRPMAISRGQGGGENAPVRLVYVADIHKFSLAGFQEPGLHDPDIQKAYYYVDTGMIAENVYLFAASRGMGAWFHNCDKPGLQSKLCLRPDQRALFGQTVGYAEK
jgi:nitroreductase